MKRGAFAGSAVVFVFRSVLVLACMCGLAACAGGAGPRPTTREEQPPPLPTSINLERAEPWETLSVAEQLLEEPVLVDAGALASLRCMKVTVKEPTPVPRRVAAEALFDALRAQGLRVERVAGMWLVSIDNAHPPAPCEVEGQGRQTAANEATGADGGVEGEAGAGASAVSAVSAGDPEAVLQEVLRSIREISPTEHAMTQRGIDLFLENQPMLMRSARIVPEQVGGKVAGIRVFGVRADGVLGRLGFENGDRLDRVMGKPVASPEEALEAYAAMRGAKLIEIEILRRGMAKKMVVRVE